MNADSVIKLSDIRLETNSDFHLSLKELTVDSGDTLAIVGANGSGKTSLIESILGMRELTSGQVEILGIDWRQRKSDMASRSRIGVQLQNATYPVNYKVADIISLHETVYRFQRDNDTFDVQSLFNKTYQKLSGGEKQRVDLHVALMHNPDIVFLDEPRSGLDQRYIKQFDSLLHDRQQAPDKTTLLCTHTGEDLMHCDSVLWMAQGSEILSVSSAMTNHQCFLKDKASFVYKSIDQQQVFSQLKAASNTIAYLSEESMGTGIVFGSDLSDLVSFFETSELIADHRLSKADGYDFLKIVANR